MPRRLALALTIVASAACAASPVLAQDRSTPADLADRLAGLRWREIGPANMGGRTVDAAGVPGDPSTVYMATASGGLWRTTNAGTTWRSIFEDGGTLSLGAVALSPSDPSVVYVGTGENNPRNSASIGDGVYRSTDGGDTWVHLGLANTEKTGRIRVHPKDPDVVWVAALGHEWGPSPERGVFRSEDGGRTWERTLFVNETTGAADLSVDPANPRVVYAAMWDHLRRPWHFRSGGPGSGLYRSADGGRTWTRLTDPALRNGLPTDTLGRIGVAVAPSRPGVVYAVIESREGVLWRSDDAGSTWRMVSDDRSAIGRPFYYADIRVDPTDENTVWALSGGLYRSIDGGRTWERKAESIHGDHQALWIDPAAPDRLVNGNDGGFHFSYDGGETWELMNTVAIGQFYHVAADDRRPYRVCGGLQDNDVWCGPSRTWTITGALIHDWYEIAGPGDGMYVQIDPRDDDVLYTTTQNGGVVRVDPRTGEARSIEPHPLAGGGQPADAREVRFNWNSPLLLSRHDPKVLYLGGNVLFRTDDRGQSWTRVSPELSKGDPARLVSSGGVTPDNSGAEHHGTIVALAESPLDASVLWAGTDDGNVHVTRDGGATWTEVGSNVPDLPEESWISHVEASATGPGAAYVAVDRHRSDDPSPRMYRTEDFGRRWVDVAANLPPRHYVHVVREDPRDADVLYAGTELGPFVSFDRGRSWTSLRLNLPRVAVRDALVHPRDNDLVIATHGRSLQVLDDVAVLQSRGAAGGRDRLVPPREAIRFLPWARRFRFDLGDRVFVGENPDYGALLTYELSPETVEALAASDGAGSAGGTRAPEGARPRDDPPATGGARAADSARVRLRVLDEAGGLVRTLRGPARAGVNRTAWDLRHERPDADRQGREGGSPFSRGPRGPLAVPGAYTVALDLPDDTLVAELVVRLDPRHDVPAADLVAQRDAMFRLLRADSALSAAADELDGVGGQLEALGERLAEPAAKPATAMDPATAADPALTDAVKALRDSISTLKNLMVPREDGSDGTGPAPLRSDLRALARGIESASARPTDAQAEWADRLEGDARRLVERARLLLEAELATLNRRLAETGVPRIGAGRLSRPSTAGRPAVRP